MTAIIIPAHNQASVIAQTLTALLQQVRASDEVIVVCNGCSDDTAGEARRFEPQVTVLETEVPSKPMRSTWATGRRIRILAFTWMPISSWAMGR